MAGAPDATTVLQGVWLFDERADFATGIRDPCKRKGEAEKKAATLNSGN